MKKVLGKIDRLNKVITGLTKELDLNTVLINKLMITSEREEIKFRINSLLDEIKSLSIVRSELISRLKE